MLLVSKCNNRIDFSCTCGWIQAKNNAYANTDKEWKQYASCCYNGRHLGKISNDIWNGYSCGKADYAAQS